jgi:hypothetical protein
MLELAVAALCCDDVPAIFLNEPDDVPDLHAKWLARSTSEILTCSKGSDLDLACPPPNGLELSCPAEAGKLSPTLRHAGGPSKPQSTPSPPGHLQRVDHMKALHLPLSWSQFGFRRALGQRKVQLPWIIRSVVTLTSTTLSSPF